MKQIRHGVFETNSSSTHSITMCMKSDYDKWVNGELYWDRWGCKLVSKDVVDHSNYPEDYYTYERSFDIEYETFCEKYTTQNGEQVVAFGYY